MRLAAAAILLAAPAAAEHCPSVTFSILQQYAEEPTPLAYVLDDGSLIQIWVNPTTQTWTILNVFPDDSACILADGVGLAVLKGDPS